MSYRSKLSARIAATGSHLCVGLDPRPELTEGDMREFCIRVIEETAPHAAALKPNIAYFEAMGIPGLQILEDVLKRVPEELPVILDCKRGDIGETQKYYARAYFEHLDVDAVTLNPFLGFDTIEPFLAYEEKAVYLLAVTSNPGSADIEMQSLADGRHVFEIVSEFAAQHDNVGMVVGLTNASSKVLERVADVPLLVPGLGAQGGDIAALAEQKRRAPSVINVSRGITYKDPEKPLAEKARTFAEQIAAVMGVC